MNNFDISIPNHSAYIFSQTEVNIANLARNYPSQRNLHQGPVFVTQVNFNPSMDKYSYAP